LLLSLNFLFPSKPTYASTCVGSQSVSLHATHITVYLNSCTTKEIITIENRSGWLAAVGSIAQVIKKTGDVGPWAGAIAAVLWIDGKIIDQVSDHGKYGISFTTSLPPSIIIPWRNG
jgi:hypothetical protein